MRPPKSVRVLLCTTLLLSSWDPSGAFSLAPRHPLAKLQLPRELGLVTDYFQVSGSEFRVSGSDNSKPETRNPQLVVLIQDLHIHPEAQRKIRGILDFLTKKTAFKDIGVIGLEGAQGAMPLISEAQRLNPVTRRQVSDFLIQEGELTGAEAYAIETSRTPLLWGIENRKYYLANRDLYLMTLKARKALQKRLEDLDERLSHVMKKLQQPEEADARKIQNALLLQRSIRFLDRYLTQQIGSEEALQETKHLHEMVARLKAIDILSASEIADLIHRLRNQIDFYGLALMRNEPMVENLLAEMDRRQSAKAVLVAGGFHTRGLTEILKKRGVSYLIVTPAITEPMTSEYTALYEQRLAKKHLSAKEVIRGVQRAVTMPNAVGAELGESDAQRLIIEQLAYRVAVKTGANPIRQHFFSNPLARLWRERVGVRASPIPPSSQPSPILRTGEGEEDHMSVLTKLLAWFNAHQKAVVATSVVVIGLALYVGMADTLHLGVAEAATAPEFYQFPPHSGHLFMKARFGTEWGYSMKLIARAYQKADELAGGALHFNDSFFAGRLWETQDAHGKVVEGVAKRTWEIAVDQGRNFNKLNVDQVISLDNLKIPIPVIELLTGEHVVLQDAAAAGGISPLESLVLPDTFFDDQHSHLFSTLSTPEDFFDFQADDFYLERLKEALTSDETLRQRLGFQTVHSLYNLSATQAAIKLNEALTDADFYKSLKGASFHLSPNLAEHLQKITQEHNLKKLTFLNRFFFESQYPWVIRHPPRVAVDVESLDFWDWLILQIKQNPGKTAIVLMAWMAAMSAAPFAYEKTKTALKLRGENDGLKPGSENEMEGVRRILEKADIRYRLLQTPKIVDEPDRKLRWDLQNALSRKGLPRSNVHWLLLLGFTLLHERLGSLKGKDLPVDQLRRLVNAFKELVGMYYASGIARYAQAEPVFGPVIQEIGDLMKPHLAGSSRISQRELSQRERKKLVELNTIFWALMEKLAKPVDQAQNYAKNEFSNGDRWKNFLRSIYSGLNLFLLLGGALAILFSIPFLGDISPLVAGQVGEKAFMRAGSFGFMLLGIGLLVRYFYRRRDKTLEAVDYQNVMDLALTKLRADPPMINNLGQFEQIMDNVSAAVPKNRRLGPKTLALRAEWSKALPEMKARIILDELIRLRDQLQARGTSKVNFEMWNRMAVAFSRLTFAWNAQDPRLPPKHAAYNYLVHSVETLLNRLQPSVEGQVPRGTGRITETLVNEPFWSRFEQFRNDILFHLRITDITTNNVGRWITQLHELHAQAKRLSEVPQGYYRQLSDPLSALLTHLKDDIVPLLQAIKTGASQDKAAERLKAIVKNNENLVKDLPTLSNLHSEIHKAIHQMGVIEPNILARTEDPVKVMKEPFKSQIMEQIDNINRKGKPLDWRLANLRDEIKDGLTSQEGLTNKIENFPIFLKKFFAIKKTLWDGLKAEVQQEVKSLKEDDPKKKKLEGLQQDIERFEQFATYIQSAPRTQEGLLTKDSLLEIKRLLIGLRVSEPSNTELTKIIDNLLAKVSGSNGGSMATVAKTVSALFVPFFLFIPISNGGTLVSVAPALLIVFWTVAGALLLVAALWPILSKLVKGLLPRAHSAGEYKLLEEKILNTLQNNPIADNALQPNTNELKQLTQDAVQVNPAIFGSA